MKTPSSFRWAPLGAALAGVLAAGTAQAQDEQGRVISSTPVIQQVAMPREVCSDESVTYQGQKSGAGALIGGIAGGAMGNAIGDGSGRAAATVIGLIGGAMLGNRIEGPGQTQTETYRQCGTQTFYENRTVSYDVVYEYAGKQYNVQLPQDPGPTISLQVTPVGAPRSEAPAQTYYASAPSVTEPATVITESRVVYVPTPVYRNYPPSYTSINLGWSAGHRHVQPYPPGFRHGAWR
mgnify:CR=1 FL=1